MCRAAVTSSKPLHTRLNFKTEQTFNIVHISVRQKVVYELVSFLSTAVTRQSVLELKFSHTGYLWRADPWCTVFICTIISNGNSSLSLFRSYLLNPAAWNDICCRRFSAAGFCSVCFVPLSALSLHSIMGFRTVITLLSLFALSVQCHCVAALGWSALYKSELLLVSTTLRLHLFFKTNSILGGSNNHLSG